MRIDWTHHVGGLMEKEKSQNERVDLGTKRMEEGVLA